MLVELAAAVRAGRVSARDLVAESLRRIEAANPVLNAVVALRAEEALADAERVDAGRTRPTGPLAGLPLLVKDLAPTVGLPTTMGSPLYADAPPAGEDDVVVARLKAAGAIVVGKTNTPAFGHTAVTTNEVFGATHNPWNLERSPGGSSGGSAASLSAGLAALATTSDGGGSVRIPASACGLVGYKPTNGAIGRSHLPRWMEFSTMGCTGTSVADVLLEASVVLGGVPGDLLALPPGAVPLEPAMPRRVVACRSLRPAVDDRIGAAFDAACDAVERELRLPVERVSEVTSAGAATAWVVMAAVELAQSLADQREAWDGFEPSLRVLVQFGAAVSTFDYVAAARSRWDECARVDALLGADAVLLTPTVNVPSWPADGPLPDRVGEVTATGIAVNTMDFNLTGHPAVSVPLGTDDAGVPFGLQVVAPRCADHLALGFAGAWERIRPWALSPPLYAAFAPTG